jgi:RNA-directed DNA polymerase
MGSQRSALHQISDIEHLRKAWRAISKRNRRSKGLDDVTIETFRTHLDDLLRVISVELRSGRYVFGKLRAHAIDKPGSTNKKRPLQIPVVRDRVVMKAIALFIAPTFDQFNLSCSFAYVKGRGLQPAIKRVQELIEAGNKYYLESDIIDFFGSVDREVLWVSSII